MVQIELKMNEFADLFAGWLKEQAKAEVVSAKWISLRNNWPEEAGDYEVRDCRYNLEGMSHYDGYTFGDPKYEKPKKGHLMLVTYTITHWRKK